MFVIHIALGGCLRRPPVAYGLTEDTGGHIAYVLGAAYAQAERSDMDRIEIVTRRFDDPVLGAEYSREEDRINDKLRIVRLSTSNTAYLAKMALGQELPALSSAFLDHLRGLDRLPDVIHCHFADAAVLGRAARRVFGIPMIYTPHSLAIDKIRCLSASDPGVAEADMQRVQRERAAIRLSDAIIVSSRDEAEGQVDAYDTSAAGRVWRINPGIPLSPGDATRDATGDLAKARALVRHFDTPEKPFLLAIARPVRKKNLIGLLDAYAESPALRARCNLMILAGQDGADPEQRAIQAQLRVRIASQMLTGKVVMPGRHDSETVAQLYALAAAQGGVFVNPALHEPFGLTLIEAARFGLPVVATRHGGPGDILDGLQHGLLVDPTSTASITDACLRLLGNRKLWRDCAAAGLANHQRYDWSRWAAQASVLIGRLRGSAGSAVRPRADAAPSVLRPTALLAFDIDGTLTGCAKGARAFGEWTISARLRGQHLAIATGRSLPEARRVLAEWALPEPEVMITSVGTEIWRRNGRAGLVMCEDFAAILDERWPRETIVDLMRHSDVMWQRACEQRRWKLSFFGDSAQAAVIRRRLAGEGLEARVIASHGRFIDIVPRDGGKDAAIAFEAARHGLGLADCVVAGDSGNDADMLARAGRAIIVGNALPELQLHPRAGLYRARARHGAGVMEGLAHFGLLAARNPALTEQG